MTGRPHELLIKGFWEMVSDQVQVNMKDHTLASSAGEGRVAEGSEQARRNSRKAGEYTSG